MSSFLKDDIGRVNFEEKFNASEEFKLEKHHKQTVKANRIVVFPMVGRSRRFNEVGCSFPKFMLHLSDGSMLRLAVKGFE